MALEPNNFAEFVVAFKAERYYASLIEAVDPGPNANSDTDREPGLGGKLLYAEDLDEDGCALVVAGNTAGAASLAASADPAAQKQAVRDGVMDFLVTSLDEALRILKNEIRKRQPVSVCVAAPPQAVEREMLERGVEPDLVSWGFLGAPRFGLSFGCGIRQIEPALHDEGQPTLTWNVAAAPALWMPKLDAIALDCLGPDEWAGRRWLRLAPRYLGRRSLRGRILTCSPEAAVEFEERVRIAVDRGEIPVGVWISRCNKDGTPLSMPRLPAAQENAS